MYNMLLVKTSKDLSPIHGIGLFAAEKIMKGTMVWKFLKGFDLEIGPKLLSKMSDPARGQVLSYAYFNDKKNTYILCSDDARFINHSDNPYTIDIGFNEEEGITVAAKDIEIGDEITSNYSSFHKKFLESGYN